MNIRACLLAAVLLLAGCATAPQQPIAFTGQQAASTRIGVGLVALPKVDTDFPGAGCLLCLAAASVANSSLTEHTHTLPTDDLVALKDQAASALKSQGMKAVIISDPIDVKALPKASAKGENIARKDFSSLQSRYQIDKLLVIEITSVGIVRPYASYIPTSDPKASLKGKAYLVNLANNTYEWYVPLDITRASNGAWDESPDFPGLTNAYFQVVELSKDAVLKPLTDASAAHAASANAGTTADRAAAP